MIFNFDVSDLVSSIDTNASAISAIKFGDVNVVTSAGTTLNDYTTNGLYYFSSSYTPVKIPAGVNGWLVVINNSTANIVKQVWLRHGTGNSNDHQTFVRTLSDGTWSTWKEFFTNADTIPIANGGTGATTAATARTALGLTYATSDTFTISSAVTLDGMITSSSEKILFSVAVDKSLENISGVTVTALSGALRADNGFIDSNSTINFVAESAYSASAAICSNRTVEITIDKSSDFLNYSDSSTVTNNTVVSFHGTMTLRFT